MVIAPSNRQSVVAASGFMESVPSSSHLRRWIHLAEPASEEAGASEGIAGASEEAGASEGIAGASEEAGASEGIAGASEEAGASEGIAGASEEAGESEAIFAREILKST
ncbi:hypothetical protein ACJRO7_018183 [Eucalyptus globulus]|uniref:Uncharacterized protein n=1 Tax=Eucalyptus globulus TaxID=34317 RepID=A0ABD3KSS2_EUCGL